MGHEAQFIFFLDPTQSEVCYAKVGRGMVVEEQYVIGFEIWIFGQS